MASKTTKTCIPKVVKDLCWDKWVGEDVAKTKCMCCGIKEIKMSSFHCGHITTEANGGQLCIDNLKPICSACNLSMGTENLEDFRKRCGFDKTLEGGSGEKAPKKTSNKDSDSESSEKKAPKKTAKKTSKKDSDSDTDSSDGKNSLPNERIMRLVMSRKLKPCPGQEKRYELGSIFARSACEQTFGLKHCNRCGFHYHYVAEPVCPCITH